MFISAFALTFPLLNIEAWMKLLNGLASVCRRFCIFGLIDEYFRAEIEPSGSKVVPIDAQARVSECVSCDR